MKKRKPIFERVHDLRADYISVVNEIYDLEQKGEASDLLIRAGRLLEEYAYTVQCWYSVCACTFCGAEYWCRDVGSVCPTCGADVSQADMLNWTIFSSDTDYEYTQHVWEEYRRRGDTPFLPKGSPVELLQMQLRAFRESLYKRTAQDHENFAGIHRASLVKIKWLRWKIRTLEGKTNKPFNGESYQCTCGWRGPLGESTQHINGVSATWSCPDCQLVIIRRHYGKREDE
jgi:hypothetical protein